MFAIAVMRVLAGEAVGEFVELGLAGEDRAQFPQSGHEGGVVRGQGTHLGQEGRSGLRGLTGHVIEIFGEIRHGAQGRGPIGRGKALGEDILRGQRRHDGPLLCR